MLVVACQRNGTAQNLPDENTIKQLSDKGKQYLADHGLPAMESTYAQYYEGIMIINYAATQGDVILYPDLIKVWIDLGNGEVCGIDARNYLFSHTERDIPEVKLTPEEAQGHVTTALEILSVRKALIAVNTNDERLCYEFKGKFGEDSFIIYINAETGAEEEIFKIIDSENGQLVI
jgi:germination protein YpeB